MVSYALVQTLSSHSFLLTLGPSNLIGSLPFLSPAGTPLHQRSNILFCSLPYNGRYPASTCTPHISAPAFCCFLINYEGLLCPSFRTQLQWLSPSAAFLDNFQAGRTHNKSAFHSTSSYSILYYENTLKLFLCNDF